LQIETGEPGEVVVVIRYCAIEIESYNWCQRVES
jgi:hypothetical protein